MKTTLATCFLFIGVVSAGRADVCKLPAAPGPCYGSFPMFFYNPATDDCERFTYGGCGGNGNRFPTFKDCAAACGEDTPKPVRLLDREHRGNSVLPTLQKPYEAVDFEVGCRPPAESGRCRGDIKRWFFNVETGRCEEFVYGGCGGNKNNYETLADCEVACLRA